MKTVSIKNFIDTDALVKDLAYSDVDLTSAMMAQSALFAHYGVLAADASAQFDLVKLKLDNTEAEVYKRERDAAAVSGEKITEGMLNNVVARDEEVIKLKLLLNKAKRIDAIAKMAVESFRHRRDMLIQQGLIEREERKGEIRVMEKVARDSILDSAKAREIQRVKNKIQSIDSQID